MDTEAQPGRAKVLIADDDPAITDALRDILEDEGYIVATTVATDLATEILREAPAVVLLDIRLAGRDGGALCRDLKQDLATRETAIILVSAAREVAEVAREAGADDYLAKPFELDDLLAKVAHFAEPAGAE